ncbi:MAG: SUF system NifU family Fe-S cluster assembly protein [Planctomycetia bacterium TMED53]|nr:MAG: SUF system NifU family Fe-S cluster assembly protein [Planctomycetia bacterium TMED53]
MSSMRELYQEMIIDHSRSPRNHGKLQSANLEARGNNPLCGDEIDMQVLRSEDGVLSEIGFEATACAICTASASILTETLKGKAENEARGIFESFHSTVTGESSAAYPPELMKLEVFTGVKDYPSRVKCATLPWHTLMQALEEKSEEASTE